MIYRSRHKVCILYQWMALFYEPFLKMYNIESEFYRQCSVPANITNFITDIRVQRKDVRHASQELIIQFLQITYYNPI